MGKPDTLDRVAQALIGLAALAALANGVFMLVRPLEWYGVVPTVAFTGPYNGHFVRDIGAAYLACALILIWALPDPRGRWLGALTGALWLGMHGAVHVYEVIAGICGPALFLADVPGVLGPPLMVLAAIAILFAQRRITPQGLPRAIALPALKQLGDGDYIDEIADAPGHAFDRYLGFVGATAHRHDAPLALFHSARIGASMAEDCGACTMIAARGALAAGMGRVTVNALLAGGDGLDADILAAFRFGQAIAAQSLDAASLGDGIERAHGRVVRLELAMAAALVRGYPAIKRGLGLAQSCATTQLSV